MEHLRHYVLRNECRECKRAGKSTDQADRENARLLNLAEDGPNVVQVDATSAPTGEETQTPAPHMLFQPYTECGEVFNRMRELPVRTVKHIPHHLKNKAATIFTGLLEAVVNEPKDLDAIARFMMFPKCILGLLPFNSKMSQTERNRAQRKAIKDRLNRWSSGVEGQKELWDNVLEAKVQSGNNEPVDQMRMNVSRAKSLVECGRLGAAIEALSSDGVRKITDEVVEALKAKHPEAPLPTRPETPPEGRPLNVDGDDVEKELMSFPRETACGRDGLRADHLKEMVRGASYPIMLRLTTALTKFVNLCLNGSLPAELAPYLASAPVTPLGKKDGGIRPIAVGETLRRLVSKCAAAKVVPRLVDYFQPHQLGVGMKDGAVGTLHACRHVLKAHGEDMDTVMIKLDCKNAFNLVDRNRMFEQVRLKAPELAAWVEYCYGTQPVLYLGEHQLKSCTGVQQGDPLGPLLFALTLMPLVQEIGINFPSLLTNVWYLDDGTIAGKIEDVLGAFQIIQEQGARFGLILNEHKCELWWPKMDMEKLDVFPPNVIRVTGNGIDLLGAPLGANDFANTVVIERVEKIGRTMELLHTIGHPHHELLLLRYCAGMPRFGYALRTADPEAISEAVRMFDQKLDEALLMIIGTGLDKKRRSLVGLPISKGGLGIPRAADIAVSAFLGSLVDTSELQMAIYNKPEALNAAVDHYIDVYNKTHDKVPPVSRDSPLLESGKTQHLLTNHIHDHTWESLANESEASFRATVLGCSMERSGKWTDLFPNTFLGLFMPADAFSAALKYRLGLEIFNKQHKCFNCSGMVDTRGHHLAVCPSIHAGHHNNLRNLLHEEAARAHLQPRMEPAGLLFGSGRDHERPADVLLPNFVNGKTLCIDVTIVSSFKNLPDAASKMGFNVKDAAEKKITKYEDAVKQQQMEFLPFAMESLGGLDKGCDRILKFIGNAINKQNAQGAANRLHDKVVFTWMRDLGTSLVDHAKKMSQKGKF